MGVPSIVLAFDAARLAGMTDRLDEGDSHGRAVER